MSHQLRRDFERDLEDSLVFLKEVLLVSWRINPAGIAACTCNNLFESIVDSTPTDQKAAMVTEVLNAIEIPPVESFENDFATAISEICKGISTEIVQGAVLEYPQIEPILESKIGADDDVVARAFTRMALSAVTKQRDHYKQLHGHFLQLIESLPRYSGIMNRSGIFDGIIAFAAGFFGGYAGVAGAEVWGNWKNSGDEEFCQKFGNAFEQFAQACIQYVNEGEDALSVIFDRLTDEIRRVHHLIFDCYDELAEAGWDIEPLHKRYRTLEVELDDDTRQLFELAVSNLDENRSVHFRTIENVRSMMGLGTDSGSALPYPRDAANESESNPTNEITVEANTATNRAGISLEFVQNVIGRFSCDGFYVGEEAPQKKVEGATGSYAPQVEPDQVLLLCDNTVFGSAKDGFLITPFNIHWRNSGEGAKFMPLDSVLYVSVLESGSIFKLAQLLLNEEKIDVNGPTVKARNQIAQQVCNIIEARKPRNLPPNFKFLSISSNSVKLECPNCYGVNLFAPANVGLDLPCLRCKHLFNVPLLPDT